MNLKLSDIKLAKNYSRTYGVGDVTELADSLAEEGQLMPVTVSSDGYLAMGFRRYAAAQKLGWEEIRVEVSDKTIEELKAANLVENLCRKDLTLWEEIVGIKDVFGPEPNVSEICRRLSKSRNWVDPRVKVWTLPQDFIDQIRLDKIDITGLRARLYNRKAPSPTSRYIGYPTQTEIRDTVTRLIEQGRKPEAVALSYALGTITADWLLNRESG